jgi:hypothetical protein
MEASQPLVSPGFLLRGDLTIEDGPVAANLCNLAIHFLALPRELFLRNGSLISIDYHIQLAVTHS